MEKTYRVELEGTIYYIAIRPIYRKPSVQPSEGLSSTVLGYYAEFSKDMPTWLNAEFVKEDNGKAWIFPSAEQAYLRTTVEIMKRIIKTKENTKE